MRISEWSSDVCSSDLLVIPQGFRAEFVGEAGRWRQPERQKARPARAITARRTRIEHGVFRRPPAQIGEIADDAVFRRLGIRDVIGRGVVRVAQQAAFDGNERSEEHTYELQSLMRI